MFLTFFRNIKRPTCLIHESYYNKPSNEEKKEKKQNNSLHK